MIEVKKSLEVRVFFLQGLDLKDNDVFDHFHPLKDELFAVPCQDVAVSEAMMCVAAK